MSTRKEVTLWCDGQVRGERCWASTAHWGERTAQAARREARVLGWVYSYVDGKDLCPDCAAVKP